MPQRVIKIVLPSDQKVVALKMLDEQKHLSFWIEESTRTNIIISSLIDWIFLKENLEKL